MPLSPSETSTLRQIERELSPEQPRLAVWRRSSTWFTSWLVSACLLVVFGLAVVNTALVVLGAAWAVGALAALWASRHLTVECARPGGPVQ